MKLETALGFSLKLTKVIDKRRQVEKYNAKNRRRAIYLRYCDKLCLRLHPRVLLSVLTMCIFLLLLSCHNYREEIGTRENKMEFTTKQLILLANSTKSSDF